MSTNRRKFLQNASTLALSASILPSLNSYASVSRADNIRVALIGCRGMGWADLSETIKHPGVECVALCDVDSNVLNKRAAELEKNTGKKVTLYSDYRKLLENKSRSFLRAAAQLPVCR